MVLFRTWPELVAMGRRYDGRRHVGPSGRHADHRLIPRPVRRLPEDATGPKHRGKEWLTQFPPRSLGGQFNGAALCSAVVVVAPGFFPRGAVQAPRETDITPILPASHSEEFVHPRDP
jgi:hypothetical protein